MTAIGRCVVKYKYSSELLVPEPPPCLPCSMSWMAPRHLALEGAADYRTVPPFSIRGILPLHYLSHVTIASMMGGLFAVNVVVGRGISTTALLAV
jgi:hypothetical protein